ncbi:MAG: MoxR family ATPase [Clostridium sp.]|nr:MoxR family ATPase [Clostridium sp.]MCM1172010.1 MoxR family ATPase [Clostridium sp.]MCM1209366.1 MoxR family ATPase [Ruminococcus sp.]
MNIKEAKAYIKDTIKIYLERDEFGAYKIPISKQRPIFMVGAPGIGKTAIMEQLAEELGVALVSYSMTHHTRQSALGLPFIKKKKYGGQEFDVSEYTMSEIISTVYDTMETSGITEGILFLDEINCVSETLAPSMLAFLQYKTFGRHKVPEGWVIVTAGNPKEYNRGVREFDVATLDRLKVMSIEPDFAVWKEYAASKGICGSVIGFLQAEPDYFYHIETTVKGRSYVTARGWEDLSHMISMYEENKITVDYGLIAQYIRNESIARRFLAYYELYHKYKNEYAPEEILSGNAGDDAVRKAREASFDERLALLGVLLDYVTADTREAVDGACYMEELLKRLTAVKENGDIPTALADEERSCQAVIDRLSIAGALSTEKKQLLKRVRRTLNEMLHAVSKRDDSAVAFVIIKGVYDKELADMKALEKTVGGRLEALFRFVEDAFGDGQEMLVLVSELTENSCTAKYISLFGCGSYAKYSERLMVSDRKMQLDEKIKKQEAYLEQLKL